MKETLVIAGSLAQKPCHGGLAWVFLQYILGFRRLGWEVLFIDRLEPGMYRDRHGQPCEPEQSFNREFFFSLMEQFGMAGSCVLSCDRGREFVGLSRQEVLERTRRSAALINVMGFLEDPEILALANCRVFLDIDPGFGQMWQDLGLADLLSGYHHYVTIGENIGRPDCAIPDCGLDWITTPQPVVLNQWPVRQAPVDASISSVVSWRGAYGPLEYKGRNYGLRAHEFRGFAALPTLVDDCFELALDIHPADARDRELLLANGWRLNDPVSFAGSPDRYRANIGRSKAEFLVAKNIYVDTRSGWFSDRSICYLASGKPVIAQDTGLQGRFGSGAGLLLFEDLEQAVEAVEQVNIDYAAHCRAARAIAESHFDSDRVLGNLLRRLGVT